MEGPKSEKYGSCGEAWIVIDNDGRELSKFAPIINWTKKEIRNKFAMSNPKFEIWLLLHFDDGNNLRNSHDCTDRLASMLNITDKGRIKKLDDQLLSEFTISRIGKAIVRAKKKMQSSNQSENAMPSQNSTNVYLLAESMEN